MSDLRNVRELCRRALDEVASAEKVYHQVVDELNQSIYDSRQQILRQDDNIEQSILGSLSRMETITTRSGRILSEMRLARAQPESFNLPSNLTIQQKLDNLSSLVVMSEDTLHELEDTAQILRIERKKWWKIW